MAATVQQMLEAQDLVEEPRVMDGYVLRQEKFSSLSLSTRLVITYDNSGMVVSKTTEDVA